MLALLCVVWGWFLCSLHYNWSVWFSWKCWNQTLQIPSTKKGQEIKAVQTSLEQLNHVTILVCVWECWWSQREAAMRAFSSARHQISSQWGKCVTYSISIVDYIKILYTKKTACFVSSNNCSCISRQPQTHFVGFAWCYLVEATQRMLLFSTLDWDWY